MRQKFDATQKLFDCSVASEFMVFSFWNFYLPGAWPCSTARSKMMDAPERLAWTVTRATKIKKFLKNDFLMVLSFFSGGNCVRPKPSLKIFASQSYQL